MAPTTWRRSAANARASQSPFRRRPFAEPEPAPRSLALALHDASALERLISDAAYEQHPVVLGDGGDRDQTESRERAARWRGRRAACRRRCTRRGPGPVGDGLMPEPDRDAEVRV